MRTLSANMHFLLFLLALSYLTIQGALSIERFQQVSRDFASDQVLAKRGNHATARLARQRDRAYGREEAGVRCVTEDVEVALWVVAALD